VPYSVFISHSTGDPAFIEKLATALRAFGVDVSLPDREWKFGPSIVETVEDAIGKCDCLLAIISKNGGAHPYVNLEMRLAMAFKKAVIPIAQEGCPLAGFPANAGWVIFGPGEDAIDLAMLVHPTEEANLVGAIALAGLALWLRKSVE